MIFPNLKFDKVVQLCDCLRFDASHTVLSKTGTDDEVEILEISPDGVTFYEVKNINTDTKEIRSKDWYLDWCYETIPPSATDGVVTPTVRVTATDGGVFTKAYSLQILTEEEDCLFSKDCHLEAEEHDILRWIPAGRTSFNYVHRRAKERIFAWLEEQEYKDCKGNPLTKDDILKASEFKEWSLYMVFKIIFFDVYNSQGDVYKDKYTHYLGMEKQASNRAFSFDLNGNGVDDGPGVDRIRTTSPLLRRG